MIYSAPQVVALAPDADEQFIQIPRIARASSLVSELLGERVAKLETPEVDRFMADGGAPSGQQFLDFSEAEAKRW